MRKGAAMLVMMGILAGGCWMRSLHPFYLVDEPVFEPGLAGTWQDKEGKITFIAEKGAKGGYNIVYVNGDKPALFTGHLAKIGGQLYLDMDIASPGSQNDLYSCSIVGTHSLFRLELGTNKLRYSYILYKWLEEGFKSGKLVIAHETLEDNKGVVITASTTELREFVGKHAEDKGMFSELAELKRIR